MRDPSRRPATGLCTKGVSAIKGLILAAGKGKRLRPLTERRPKPLVPICGRPILQYNIENLRDAGVRDIIVVVNHDGPQIKEHFRDGAALGVGLTYVSQDELLGTAHAVYQAKDTISGDSFALVFGDNMTGYRLCAMVQDYERLGGSAMLAVSEGGDPRKHAVISIDGDRVRLIEERPAVPKSPYTSAGMFVFGPAIFDAIERIEPVATGEYYLPHAVQLLIDKGHPVHYTVANDWRVNINSPGDLLEAQKHVLEDVALLNRDAHMADYACGVEVGAGVQFRGPVSLGRYTYIGHQCDIGHNARIANSMLMDRVRIGANCIIHNAILGIGAVVPSGTRLTGLDSPLVVGDGQILGMPA